MASVSSSNRYLCWAVVSLFVLACLLPCIACEPHCCGVLDFEGGSHLGLSILLLGWGGGNNGVPWSGNVFLVLGLACLWFRWFRTAAVMGGIAAVLGLTTWWVRRFDTMMVGYYVWQASQLVLVGGAVWACTMPRISSVACPQQERNRDEELVLENLVGIRSSRMN